MSHSRKFIDLTGKRFGRLVVVERHPENAYGYHPRWVCRCDCGATTTVLTQSLRRGATKSCGCGMVRHGHARQGTRTKEYKTWASMIQRCYTPSATGYPWYGGRGITVHPEWVASFEAFLRDVGPAPAQERRWSIDRIDPDGHYVPGNVRWVETLTQANNRRDSRKLTHGGETLTIPQWSRKTGLSIGTIVRRIKLGWDASKTLTTIPIRGRNQFTHSEVML